MTAALLAELLADSRIRSTPVIVSAIAQTMAQHDLVDNRVVVTLARAVQAPQFLEPDELASLTRFFTAHEPAFVLSEVISATSEDSLTDLTYRRSRVLPDLGPFRSLMADRVRQALPEVLARLELPTFPVDEVEVQLTRTGHGGFFRMHTDNDHNALSGRVVTFVYFCHRTPKRFGGGELCLYDTVRLDGQVTTGSARVVVPEQNMAVFFPSALMHEVKPVDCSARRFGDGRFTLNGWARRR